MYRMIIRLAAMSLGQQTGSQVFEFVSNKFCNKKALSNLCTYT